MSDGAGPGAGSAFTIRPAEPADVGRLVAIENESFDYNRLEPRAFRHAVRSPTIICLVALDGGQRIVGYGMVHWRRRSPIANLTSIAVLRESAGGGLGRRLLDALETETAAAGARTMLLEVKVDNEAARRLYESAGYREYELIEDYYEDGAAARCYEKQLEHSAFEVNRDCFPERAAS